MKIAIPYADGQVAQRFGHTKTLRIYEDDHGRILRFWDVAVAGEGHTAVIQALAPYSVETVLCDHIGEAGETALMEEGILVRKGLQGSVDTVVLQFLNGTVFFDPANTCNACGHGKSCSMGCSTSCQG